MSGSPQSLFRLPYRASSPNPSRRRPRPFFGWYQADLSWPHRYGRRRGREEFGDGRSPGWSRFPFGFRFQYERRSLGVRSGVKKQAWPTIVQLWHGFGVRELRWAKVQAYLLITNEPPVAGGLQRLRDEVRALYEPVAHHCYG
jgi:hypothetical protein